jgi:hypothetical protein
LIERAGRQVHPRELLDVLDEGVTMLVATREAGEYEYGGASISAESFKRIGHRMTIPISDLSVKVLEAIRSDDHLEDCSVSMMTLVLPP